MEKINLTSTKLCGNISLDDRYLIIPYSSVDKSLVVNYWSHLADNDLIKFRLGDISNPGAKDVQAMILRNTRNMYYIADASDATLVAEFTVVLLSGQMGAMHFSANPKVTFQEAIAIGKWATDRVLKYWKYDDEPYLTSIIGIIPKSNKKANTYIRRVGFKRVTEVPNGCKYLGELDTAVINIKSN